MNRQACVAVFLGLLIPGIACSALKPGYIPAHVWLRLAPHVSTQQDVLDLFGPPDDKVEVKADKFLRYVDNWNKDRVRPCLPEGSARVSLWKYNHVNTRDGDKYSYDDRRDREYAYIAFHDDGRVCGAVPSNEDH